MNHIERLAAILLLLQEKSYTSDEIAHRFEVSRRTILRDIQALSEMGVPIIAQEGPGGGYSLPRSFHTQPLPLTPNEAFLLMLALGSLESLSDLPFREELTSLKSKLRVILPQSRLTGAEEMLATIGIDGSAREKPAPYLETLMEAAAKKRWLKVVYQSSDRLTTQHLLPRQVFTQNGYWYLRAYTHEHQQERTYRIDRMQVVDLPDRDFQPGTISPTIAYDHISHPEVSVHLTSRGVAKVETDRHLSNQIRKLPDGTGELIFRCPPGELDWFAHFFASFGPEAEVRAPEELRQKMADLGKNLLQTYQKR